MAKKIAIYGKGGVGKTTLAANLSAALAGSGRRVLLIGCNPVADSSHLLTGEKVPVSVSTILERDTESVSAEIITIGYQGVGCLEVGAPVDSYGCSSRSIATALDAVHESGMMESFAPDFVIYDMPGDLGCSGELTLEKRSADLSLIVTSADFQSIFAANRMLGLLQRAAVKSSLAIVINGSASSFEDSLVEDFAGQVGVTLAAAIPRSFAVRHSELYGKTVVEAGPLSSLANVYRSLARHIADDEPVKSRKSLEPLNGAELKEWALEWGRRLGELEFGIISDGAGI